jgi:hypothetical protein
MAAEPLPVPAGAPRELHRELHVVALLKSYRQAMALASGPPESLRLMRPLRWIHLRARPRWACRYFTTRYVRRRVDALERALAARIAVGEADADDDAEAAAIARFKSSLPPVPSRLLAVTGLVAGLLLAQALVGGLFTLLPDSRAERFKDLLRSVGLKPDVKVFADTGSLLLSANYVEHGVLLIAVAATLYVLGRPLASGYRLSYMCLGRGERLGRLRRRSELCSKAAELDTAGQEQAAVQAAGADFRRDAPIDLLAKALPALAIAYWLIGVARFGGIAGVDRTRLAEWTMVSVLTGAAIVWATRRLSARGGLWRAAIRAVGAIALIGASLAIVGRHALAQPEGETIWFALAAVVLARLGWLVLATRDRSYPPWWIVAPLAAICTLAVVSHYDPAAEFSAPEPGAVSSPREAALEQAGLGDLPSISRADLRTMLVTHERLYGADLRGDDLHGLSLRRKRLVEGRLELADLRGAVVAGADLSRADLTGADLSCSDLRGVDLGRARVSGATIGQALADKHTRWPRGSRLQRDDVVAPEDVGVDGYDYTSLCLVS